MRLLSDEVSVILIFRHLTTHNDTTCNPDVGSSIDSPVKKVVKHAHRRPSTPMKHCKWHNAIMLWLIWELIITFFFSF